MWNKSWNNRYNCKFTRTIYCKVWETNNEYNDLLKYFKVFKVYFGLYFY